MFDINYDGQNLVPTITELEFIEGIEDGWIPDTPDERQGKRFYGKLLGIIERIENQVSRLEMEEEKGELIVVGNNKGEQLNWQHYDFKNRISEVKERVRTMLLGFRDHHFQEAPAIPLRLKRVKSLGNDWYDTKASRAHRKMVKDQLFQQEGLQEITEYYRHAAAQFDSLSSEFIDNYLNVFLLQLSARGFLKGRTDTIIFHLESGITGLGKTQIDYLFEHYKGVFKLLDIRFTENRAAGTITAEGYSLYDLFKGEEGIHMFYGIQQSLVPIKLAIKKETETDLAFQFLKVVRVYNEGTTLTDVRTGYSNAITITPQESKLLLFAGVDRNLRKDLVDDKCTVTTMYFH